MHRPPQSFFSTIAASIIRAMMMMLQRRQNVPSFRGGRGATKPVHDRRTSRYMPHQGTQEMARRVRQLEGRG